MAPTTKRLVIVESPAKAKTIAGYLGDGYIVESSLGHIRDLPRNAKEVPAKYAKEPWSRLGVDVDNDFKPLYVVNPDRKAHVKVLKDALAQVDELLLATDEDREGEAIAFHLLETLKPKVPVKRMVFHEITKSAIQAAVANPREIYRSLVDAQEARRILDRLYGYEVSPVLWKKVMPRLSAGRVQSVATRIVVERERARMKFVTADYWGITAHLRTEDATEFAANLIAFDGDRVATGKDFDPETGRARGSVVHLDEAGARGLAERLDGADYQVTKVENKPYRRRPYAPFITSTLQQEASRKLRQSSAQTMRIAQRLYDNGYITYMRTDSTNLSETALTAARRQAAELFGQRYVPAEPRRYAKKVKNAQEAHEAIRPAGDNFRTPDQLAAELSTEDLRLYELIWRRTIASQMTDAVGNSTSVRIAVTSSTGEQCEFGASGKTITDPGFLKAYVESRDEGETDDAERRLPQLERGDALAAERLEPAGHRTQPPARYTEASLVKALEERGIGRPSTYASIMQTIQDRGYVFKRGQALIPAFLAFAVVGLMENHFGRLVDYDFTAGMESELDNIAAGDAAALTFLRDFYFGGRGDSGSVAAAGGLKHLVGEELGRIDARGVNSIPLFTDGEGRRVVARVGRYGPYLERFARDADPEEHGERVSIPESMAPDEVTPEKVDELYEIGSGERELGTHPETGEPVHAKSGRYGPYVTSGEKTASLLSDMKLSEITLEDAVKLLTLPRLVGTDPEGEEIRTGLGPHGPYVVKKRDYRSLANEEQLFTLTLEEAEALLAQPKQRGRRAAKPPLKELGEDPATKLTVVIKDGRFGPYATDGETNASLKKTDTIEDITIDRASELLAERRSKGPSTKKTAAKKTTAKKTAAKKTTKKAAKKATKKSTTTAAAAAKKSTTTARTVKKGAAKKAAAKKKTGNPKTD
ncbi:DNA topoisomerase I [Stackebrandtia endophytica]|uniref:DNA topoisomerase 1 n=1 Tax=Stackebrandtia endophytica TaxID=1496996 RepID=A0A543AWD6_9ACTN|nr:type I DNA topoisomerase [Stackebrandtia endophytica]TQL76874.1 DNA topoisomerase I [Stackebrandtia endophytica]